MLDSTDALYLCEVSTRESAEVDARVRGVLPLTKVAAAPRPRRGYSVEAATRESAESFL